MNTLAILEDREAEEDLKKEVQLISVFNVVDADTHKKAGDLCKQIVAMEKKVKEYWETPCDAAHKTWKMLVAKREELLNPLAANKMAQTELMKKWEWAEEEKRRQAERKAQEEARKRAEEEALAQAIALEKEGTKESKAEAEKIITEPVQTPVVVVPKTVPAGYGSFTRKVYKASVFDLMALARSVVEGKVPVQAIQGNDVFLGSQARALKESMNYPGVKVWFE